jgi:ABC-type nitrate/sulfonate/bicarbonate transport system substrate-binding protein
VSVNFLEDSSVVRTKTLAIVVAVVVISAFAVYGFWYLTTPRADVRIGYLNQDLHQLALRVALVNGYFDDVNITVDVVEFGNGAYEMDGFLADQIDMGYLGAAPALTKRLNQDILITVFASVNLEGSAIMVKKSEYDSGAVTSIANLTGKGVHHPGPSTVQNFLLRLALENAGMTYEDIDPVYTPPPYMESALTAEAPAFIAWEPFCAKAEYNDAAVLLMNSGEIWPHHPCCVVASANSFLEVHPDVVQKVIDVHKRAEQWIVDHPLDAIAIAVDWLEMDQSPVENAFNRIIFDYDLNMTGLTMYLEFLIDQDLVGLQLSEVASFMNGFVNTTFVES